MLKKQEERINKSLLKPSLIKYLVLVEIPFIHILSSDCLSLSKIEKEVYTKFRKKV